MKKKTEIYSGINIQYPISQKIISGLKTIETRTYPLPTKFIGTKLLIIETPGKSGKFKSRIIGFVKFKSSFKYKSKRAFYADAEKHHVDENSLWAWNPLKPKWGWEIETVEPFKVPVIIRQQTGILYTHKIKI